MDGIEVLLKDFGNVSKKAFNLRDKSKKVGSNEFEKSIAYSMALDDLKFFNKDKLVWYDGKEGFMPEVSIGTPKDYVQIRDNFDSLKEFLAKTLDRGRVHAGGGTHGDSSRETNCAEYIGWMYQNTSNQNFKDNVVTAVNTLLVESFNKTYNTLDVDTTLKAERESNARIYKSSAEWFNSMLHRDDINTALWRLGLDYNLSTEDNIIKEKFIAEVKKTERPITLEEVYKRFGGTKEELKESYDSGKFKDDKRAHFDEIPLPIKEEITEWHTQSIARKTAIKNFSPQFNRLVGLLDLVGMIGKHDQKFDETYNILREKAVNKFMIDTPTLTYFYSGQNIYQNILVALSTVQQGNQLEKFWLENIKTDPNTERVIASVHGLLTMHDSMVERRKLIPSLLQKFQERGYDTDKNYQRPSPLGFTDENLLNDILSHVTNLSYPKHPYHYLNKTTVAIDFLLAQKVEKDSYNFRFIRYSPTGESKHKAVFNILNDNVEGDKSLDATIRAYINDEGYKLPNNLTITSLEGRKITEKALIVNPEEHNIEGLYEGIIGINHTHMPFIYNPAESTLLIAPPTESKTVMFGVRGNWAERRIGIDKITETTPYNNFQELNKLGESINALVVERRNKRYLGDSVYSLQDKITSELTPYITNIISSILITRKDGLAQ